MMRLVLAFIILGSMPLASLSQAAIIRGPGAPGTGTPPNAIVSTSSHTSDFKTSKTAKQQATTAITLGEGQDLLKLTFWGEYTDNSNPTDNLTLRVWGPATGLTSNVGDAIFNSPISPTKNTYGTDTTLSNTYYQYSVDFTSSPIAFTQSGDYFISIVNDTSNASAWAWTSTDDSLNRNLRAGENQDWFTIATGDLAFQSEHAPEPGSIAVLSLAAVGLAFGAWRRRKKQKPVPA